MNKNKQVDGTNAHKNLRSKKIKKNKSFYPSWNNGSHPRKSCVADHKSVCRAKTMDSS